MWKPTRILTSLLLASAAVSLGASAAAAVTTVSPAQLTTALHWRSLGPYRGGIVEGVSGVASQPNRYYMGAGGGGVWETNNYGHSWKNISDKYFENNNIGAIAVAPSNPEIIYVGTGDSAARNTLLTGDGMYKSVDGGKTWNRIGLTHTGTISWIAVDPQNANIVYVAALGQVWAPNAQRGVFKTTNGGQTWKKVLFVNDKTGATTLAMDPKDPNVIYATMWQMYRRMWFLSSGGPGSGLYKSTNGGATWTNITHNTGLPSGIWGNSTISLAPSDPNVLYALIQAKYKGTIGGLFRSTDGGQSWQLQNSSPYITQRAFYFLRTYVDPKDANTLYILNVLLYVSHDAGKTLTALPEPHVDNHAMWINPDHPNLIVEGNDGGATVTRDGGQTWSSDLNQPTGEYYHANLDNQFPFHIYAAQQDDGSYTGPSAVASGRLPATWTPVQGGEFGWVVPKPGKPWITYANGYYSDVWRDDRRTGLVTQVSPWPGFKFGLAGSKIKYRFGWWFRPTVFAPHNPNKLFIGANVLFEQDGNGTPWRVISPDLTRNDPSKEARSGGPINADMTGEEMYDTISSIAVSPLSADVIWVGSDDGLVHVTTDGGKQWSEVRPPSLPKWAAITCIDASSTAEGTAYVSASRYEWNDFRPYVYKTIDYGKHWTKITNGLPSHQYVESVRQDPDAPNLLFAGTSKTVYFSTDGGSHWLPLTLNLPPVRITDIAIQPQQHAVVLSTYGRAFWALDNLQFLEQLSTANVTSSALHLFKPQQTWLVKRTTRSFARGVGGQNLSPGATVFYYLPNSYRAGTPVELRFTTTGGKVIDSLQLPVSVGRAPGPMSRGGHRGAAPHAGMNRFLWNLRYPTATEIKGVFHAPRGANVPIGPEVVPGTYDVVLTYAGITRKQPFVVKLDPRIKSTQADLEQRFDLMMQIQEAINHLDVTVNKAIKLRSEVNAAVAHGKLNAGQARSVIAALTRDINGVVDFRIQSSRGFDVYPPRLRAWLSAIYSRVGTAFVKPTVEMQQVATEYIHDERVSAKRLGADTMHAARLIGPAK